MSDIDTTEGIDAAARAAFTDWAEVSEAAGRHLWVSNRARALINGADEWRQAITAALPHIERWLREQIARDIEADALDAEKGIPFDHDQDVATVVAWIGERFDQARAAEVEDDAEREPYDPSDEWDYFNDDWEMDR